MRYDVVVVGAGHAGCEAAVAAARMGVKTAILCFHEEQIGRLSCNPAMGGLAKGCLVREIDALGGVLAQVTDRATIQFRRLNTRKGLAVQASRAQVDVAGYPAMMRAQLAATPGLDLLFGEASALRVEGGRVTGLILADGRSLTTQAVVLTTGTFLGGVLHRGEERTVGGRIGEAAAHHLSRSMAEAGVRLMRLKTGTTPRVDAATIAWDRLELQPDEPTGRFSFGPPQPRYGSRDVYITYTNQRTHEIIRENLQLSSMYCGSISGRGPRYCPSIEDKIVRFGERERHQLFLEPEGLDTPRVYINGTSTSLPAAVQDAMIRSIVGLEEANILQYGYAVEYDAIDPTQLGHDLQLKALPGLYCAGQLNGTSGYEEAAAQGLIAGINAARPGELFRLGRDEAYIGVLVDDLVTRGVGGEPYRMFPSRAEHRLHLREDNADRRLMEKGRQLGLIGDEVWARFEAHTSRIHALSQYIAGRALNPDAATQAHLSEHGLPALSRRTTLSELLRRPEVEWSQLAAAFAHEADWEPDAAEQVEVDTRYAGYLSREEGRRNLARRMEAVSLDGLDFRAIAALSVECRERLATARPATLGAAARLPGITPAAIDTLALVLVKGAGQIT